MNDRFRRAFTLLCLLVLFAAFFSGCRKSTVSDPSQRPMTPIEQQQRAEKSGK